VLIAAAVGLILTVVGLPSLTNTLGVYRIAGDAKNIAGSLAQAKMRAGATFSREQIQMDTTNKRIQFYQRLNAGASWVAEGGPRYLSSGVSFGYGTITAPAGGQSAISQSTAVTFNSRGIPIDDSTGQPKTDYAIYVKDGSGRYYAITVSLSGRSQIWKYSGTAWVAQ